MFALLFVMRSQSVLPFRFVRESTMEWYIANDQQTMNKMRRAPRLPNAHSGEGSLASLSPTLPTSLVVATPIQVAASLLPLVTVLLNGMAALPLMCQQAPQTAALTLAPRHSLVTALIPASALIILMKLAEASSTRMSCPKMASLKDKSVMSTLNQFPVDMPPTGAARPTTPQSLTALPLARAAVMMVVPVAG